MAMFPVRYSVLSVYITHEFRASSGFYARQIMIFRTSSGFHARQIKNIHTVSHKKQLHLHFLAQVPKNIFLAFFWHSEILTDIDILVVNITGSTHYA